MKRLVINKKNVLQNPDPTELDEPIGLIQKLVQFNFHFRLADLQGVVRDYLEDLQF